eukprot:TRINITY_DN3786_c0_g1_i1.p1 TRINITY_DN3786_c0_g1~~TRINITY_DN3786_c0_g1_i1.p1  ORF type:complete len:198 (+),score=39.01 TRINITY_DN3786_c0_g1_i1:142-735(+)
MLQCATSVVDDSPARFSGGEDEEQITTTTTTNVTTANDDDDNTTTMKRNGLLVYKTTDSACVTAATPIGLSPKSPSYRELLAQKNAAVYRNNYRQSVIQHKQEYWKHKCWCEVQKTRKTRPRLEAFKVLDRYERLDRWEQKKLCEKVDWQAFYEEMRANNAPRPHPLVAALSRPSCMLPTFAVVFAFLYCCLLYLCS